MILHIGQPTEIKITIVNNEVIVETLDDIEQKKDNPLYKMFSNMGKAYDK